MRVLAERRLLLRACMSHQRQYVPGRVHMVTRRVIGRHYLLRPDSEAGRVWLYALAVMADKYGIKVHHFVLMSTHEHIICTDTRGVMGAFLRDFHGLVAKAMKRVRSWDGIFWDGSDPSVVHLTTTAAFIEKSGYQIANPVAALAVEHSKQWPGLIVRAHQVGNITFVATRPDVYFDPKGWPQTVTLRLTMPQLSGVTDEQAREMIAAEADRLESEARYNARAEGKTFMGAFKAAHISPRKRSTTREPRNTRNPTFAVGRDNREAYVAVATSLREFRRRYREALAQWRDGIRDVLFPPGTYVMAWLHHANVAPA